jgi:citrate lyase subunit alpha/citrate CoA-transferase
MYGAVGVACTKGAMNGLSVLRSHGGRQRAIADGGLQIDAAFIAAPCADAFGNANGLYGRSACGPLSYPVPDSLGADRVAVITDGLVPFPCAPQSISGGNVDYVLVVDSIGDSARIVSGSTRLTRSPTQLLIADLTARFIEETGIMREGFSFQAGAGGISLASTVSLAGRMRKRGVKASFAHGGATGILVALLEEGLIGSIIDLQSFDLEAVRSCRENPRHIESTPFDSYGPRSAGCAANMLDVAILGATEIDLDFNVNVNTHSDGLLLHGIGGHTDAAASAACTIITAPSFRKRIPIIRERVTTASCPGEVVDVVVTERGIAVNPRRPDLAERARSAGLPLVSLEGLMSTVHSITGVPEQPLFGERIVALVEWRDGTIIDVIREVEGIQQPPVDRGSDTAGL